MCEYLNQNKISKAQNELLWLFVMLCNAKKIIDTKLYDDVINFKEVFFDDIYKNFIGRDCLRHEKFIKTNANVLLDKFNLKCKELSDYCEAMK